MKTRCVQVNRPVVMLAVAIMLGGCATTPPPMQDVSFIAQENPNRCGTTCLAMVLQFFDIAFDPATLEKQTYLPALQGTTPQVLADTAIKYGLDASIEVIDSPVHLAAALEQGALPVIFIPPIRGQTIGHFALITGASANTSTIRAHSGNFPHDPIRLPSAPWHIIRFSRSF